MKEKFTMRNTMNVCIKNKFLCTALRFNMCHLLFLLWLLFISTDAYSQQDYIHLNKVIAKLEKGKLVTGIWGSSVNLNNARRIIEYNEFPSQDESINKPMIDFILTEMEHFPYDITDLRIFTLGLNSRREVLTKGNLQPSLATFVRLPVEGNEPVHAMIKQVLDAGVHGVVIPHVRTPEDVLKIVKACRYVQPVNSIYKNPKGNRGFSPGLCSYLWGVTEEEYYKRADVWPLNPEGDIMVIIMIEDTDGVKNIEEILKVPGIGAVFFGPADYRVSSGNFGNETFNETVALNKVKDACDSAGIPLIGLADPENIAQKVKDDYKMLIIGSSVDLTGSADKVFDYLKTNY